MLLRRLTDYLLSSRWRALAIGMLASFIPIPGGNLGILVAGLVTLRQGALEGSLVFCATIFTSVLGYFFFRTPETAWLTSEAAQWGFFAFSLLTWLLVLTLRVFASWAVVAELGALIALIVVAVLHVVFPDLQAWWVTQLTTYFNQVMPQMGGRLPDDMAQVTGFLADFSRYATGVLAASFLFNILTQVVLARAWETVVFMPGQLRRELYMFRPGWISAIVTVLLLVLDLMGVAIAIDLLPVMILLFALAGLSLMHAVCARMRKPWVMLILVYVGICFTLPWSLIGIAIPGLLDVWVDFRARLTVLKK